MATEFHFYTDTLTRLDGYLNTYVSSTAASVMSSISGAVKTALAIYVCLWGWSIMRGMVSEPITDGVQRIVRLSLIAALALNIGYYNAYISNFLWSAPDAMAAVVAGAPSNISFLDTLLSKIYARGDAFWTEMGISEGFANMGYMAMAVLIWIAGIAVTGFGAFLLILSKMALAILLGVGPIFVALMIFEPTKKLFDAWLGQALNYFALAVLAAAGIKLILTIIDAYMTANPATDFAISHAIPLIAMCVIGMLVLTQVPSIASALGGGVAVSTLGAVGWAYGKAKGTASAMRPTNLKRSYNRAKTDARLAGRGAKAVAMAPKTMLYDKIANRSNKVAQG